MRTTYSIFLSSVVLCACAMSCTPKSPPDGGQAIVPSFAGKDVYLRASVDDDPSSFIGRFVSDNVSRVEIDEMKGVQSVCSQHISYKTVRAGGQFSKFYQVSSDVSTSLGVNPVPIPEISGIEVGADVGVSAQRGDTTLVEYTLTEKMMAEIKDVAALDECCAKNPGACSRLFIGEFWRGTGKIYSAQGRARDVKGSVAVPTKGDVGVKVISGWSWRQSQTFEDMYFAMRVTQASLDDSCAWADRIPRSEDGEYFVGVSQAAATESTARDDALRHARKQVVNYLGEYIMTRETSVGSTFKGYLEDERIVETSSQGLVSLVKDERYCPAELIDTPDGKFYKVKVLAYLPNEQREAALKATVEAIKEEKATELSTQERDALDELMDGVSSSRTQDTPPPSSTPTRRGRGIR